MRIRPDLPWVPPGDDPQSRVLPKKVWELADVHAIARTQLAQATGNLILPITNDCTSDIQNLQLTATGLADRLLQLRDANYDKSMWCQRSKKEGVKVPDEALWFPCDAYGLHVVERVDTGWEGSVEYYFKLSLTQTKAVVLLVSVHL